MARKPIHLQATGKLTPRDRIWAAIRATAPLAFNVDDIARVVIAAAPKDAQVKRVPEKTISSYLEALTRAGYLEATVTQAHRNGRGQIIQPLASYKLLRDCGIEAPRLTKAGEPVTQGSGREALWRTMKILKNFTRTELARSASTASLTVSDRDAKHYLRYLEKAGYVVVQIASKPGTQARWRFVAARNTGPKPPMIQRALHVYDPNLGQAVWHPEVDA